MGGTGVRLSDPSPTELNALHTHGGHSQGAKQGTQGQAGGNLCSGLLWCLDPDLQLQEGFGDSRLDITAFWCWQGARGPQGGSTHPPHSIPASGTAARGLCRACPPTAWPFLTPSPMGSLPQE